MDLPKNRKHELVWLAFKLEKDKIFMYKKKIIKAREPN
jgi:hypothetical protein